jgi:ribonuclease HII
MPRADARPRPHLRYERSLDRSGIGPIAGLDEVGRGALAGPIFAAVVVLPVRRARLATTLREVHDSKLMTAGARRRCAELIRRVALDWAVGQSPCEEIDDVGPLVGSRRAMMRAVAGLRVAPRHLLIDHLLLPELEADQTALPHGDARVLSIASASVLAKVARDEVLEALARQFPTYGFNRHKGYGTAAHLEALRRWGPCPIHRRHFEPVSVLLEVAAPIRDPQSADQPRGEELGAEGTTSVMR